MHTDTTSRRSYLRSWRVALAATALVATTTVLATDGPAVATLAGSSFNGADASPTSDVAAGASAMTDPTATSDTTNYGGGSTDDDICPTVATGTAPNASDLDAFYFGAETNASGVFVYLAWHRMSTSGTTTLDFELNQSSETAPGCGSHQPARTAGDLLVTYDFTGSGGAVTLSRRTWVGTSAAGAWSAATTLTSHAEGSVNATGDFGEMVINATGSGLLPSGTCTSFAGAFAKSRASVTFNSQIKDFTARATRTVSNCGSVPISKTDDASPANPLGGAMFGLYTDVANAPGVAVTGKTCTTAAAGTCTITDVLPGTYWIVETSVPTGHSGPAVAQQVTVAASGNTPPGTFAFVNPRLPASVMVRKKNDAGAALSGATFALFTDNGGAAGTAVTGKTCTTIAAGTCTISNILPAGTYWLRETVTPAGHVTAADQKVTLSIGQSLTVDVVNVRMPASIALTKTVNGAHPAASSPLLVPAGSALNYVLTITNTGSLPLTIDQLNDTLVPNVASTCTQGVGSALAPAASFTCTYTSAANQPESNIATVAAVDPLGRFVTADDATSVKPVGTQVTLTKTGPDYAHVGDTVEYTLAVVNTGDHPVTDVTVSDPLCSSPPASKTKTGGDQDHALEPGETWTYTCSHVVASADGGSLTNTAEVVALDPLLRAITAVDSHTLAVLHPALELTKTASATSVAVSDTVTFTYVITNTGDALLRNVVVSDDVLGVIAVVPSLAPGESATRAKAMSVTASSPATNVGTATGTDVLGRQVSSSAAATITIVLGLVLENPRLPRTGFDVTGLAGLGASLVLLGGVFVLGARRRQVYGSKR
jgi:uncharacterized repeat protein (TIGR01451 family)/LPXTG-motif cell wall-anchored protein